MSAWWSKKRVMDRIKMYRKEWNMQEGSYQDVVDYIMRHPAAVQRDFYKIMADMDFPEWRPKAAKGA